MELNPVLNDVLMAAFSEAKNKKHEYLTPEHILYASLNFEEGRKIIEGSGGDVRSLKKNIEDYFSSKVEETDVEEPRQSAGFRIVWSESQWHTLQPEEHA
jgi:ATP-dependent Clp protease ATP-binding subunit ClpA